jgi:hypothetical protein
MRLITCCSMLTILFYTLTIIRCIPGRSSPTFPPWTDRQLQPELKVCHSIVLAARFHRPFLSPLDLLSTGKGASYISTLRQPYSHNQEHHRTLLLLVFALLPPWTFYACLVQEVAHQAIRDALLYLVPMEDVYLIIYLIAITTMSQLQLLSFLHTLPRLLTQQ